jgi:hypothetical protein
LSPEDIESTLSQQAQLSEVSVAKLRAVYIRGVKEAVASGQDGSLHDYGLARVQRFTTALSTQNPRVTHDHDLMPRTLNAPITANLQMEFTEDDLKTFQIVSAILSGDISQAIPEAEEISFDSETRELTLTTPSWSAKINLKTEEYSEFSKK